MNVEVWQETFLMSQQYSVEEWKPYRTDQSYSGLMHILSSASLHPPAQLPPTFTSTPPPIPTPLLSPGVSVTIHVLCKFPYFPCGQCSPAQPISKLQSRKWSPQILAHLVNFSKHGLPCLMIIKSCYFDCRIIQSFTCSRCVICILCSVHLILMYMCTTCAKDHGLFYLDYPQINEVRSSYHLVCCEKVEDLLGWPTTCFPHNYWFPEWLEGSADFVYKVLCVYNKGCALVYQLMKILMSHHRSEMLMKFNKIIPYR